MHSLVHRFASGTLFAVGMIGTLFYFYAVLVDFQLYSGRLLYLGRSSTVILTLSDIICAGGALTCVIYALFHARRK
jgi:hypothetical protein